MDSRQRDTEDYVTIVSVGNNEGNNVEANVNGQEEEEVPFVTVVSIGELPSEEEVIIYRLPGEKLGFGLKFEGGTKSAECVRRLFIQSCAPDSPAGRARAAWGSLQPGDEILRIDNLPVTHLTRLECVRCLKDSNVAVALLVRHANFNLDTDFEVVKEVALCDISTKALHPPPVPPRKIPRKQVKDLESKGNNLDCKKLDVSFKNLENSCLDNGLFPKKGPIGKQSPGRSRRPAPSPTLNALPPPEAQVYTDLFCHEKENGILIAESESDDTGSSISTVIDRLSVYSSFPGSVENSIPSTPTLGSKHLNNVFSCLDSIGQTLMADIATNIAEDTSTKSISIHSSYEKLPLTKTRSGASDDSAQQLEEPPIRLIESKLSDPLEANPVILVCENISLVKDPNNNKNQLKDINMERPYSFSVPVDVVDGSIVNIKKSLSHMEAPKPKPRNMNRKPSENTFAERKYDENLSLTKLHCIESWLQDSISCKIATDSPSDIRVEDHEINRPEALPRLIDFIPKTQSDCSDIPDKTSPHEIDKDICKKEVNNLRVIIREPCQDWCGSGTSPQLETIYEDLSTCPTLLIDESSRHPPAGDSGSDQGTQASIEESSSLKKEVKEITNDAPEIKVCEIKAVEEKTTPKKSESDVCGVPVSRGPRSPPDGRENPAVHHEELSPPPLPPLPPLPFNQPPTLIAELNKTWTQSNPKPINKSDLKEIKKIAQTVRTLTESPKRLFKTPEKTYGRGKDAKSEGSVKDKIAMFSVNKTVPPEPTYCGYEKKTMNNNKVSDSSSNHVAPRGRSISLQMDTTFKTYENNDWNGTLKNIDSNGNSDSLGSYTLPRPKNESEKISPIVLLNRALSASDNYKTESASIARKNTLDQIIEQRRKSMCKLRGLVIPESSCVINLPEIKSRDSLSLLNSSITEKKSKITEKQIEPIQSPVSPLMSLWDSKPIVNNIPKYSPAFKRKSLQVYGPKVSKNSETSKSTENVETIIVNTITKSQVPVKPPRMSLDFKKPFDSREISEKTQTLPHSFKTGNLSTNYPTQSKPKFSELPNEIDSATFKSPKIFSDTADSDNDSSYLSTVSSPTPSLNTVDNTESDCSSQSIVSQNCDKHFIKNETFDYGIQHALYRPENGKMNVCRSLSSDTSTSAGSSNSSTLTSGSQASCSSAGSTDTGSNRVLKPRSIEAINRKNILASAKCRSGKDNKFGSPLIERKFSDVESTDEDIISKPENHSNHLIPKSRLDSVTANSIMRVAYQTVVEDKCPLKQDETDSTCSDDSDCDFGSVTLSKAELSLNKYTNGVSVNNNKLKTNDVGRRLTDNVKPSLEEKVKRTVEHNLVSNNVEAARRTAPRLNYIEDVAKGSEYESFDASSCGVSEDEQDSNWCEVKLSRGASGGVGVTLAGGADCEAKQVTIHKVLQGSAAERDGRLRKGDRVISINGHTMKNVTHAQSVAILKEVLPEVTIVVCGKRTAETPSSDPVDEPKSSAVISVVLNKTDDAGGAGLGISLQGGGSRPLLINKLFAGGAAANSGRVLSGSELVAAGSARLAGLTRTQAWGLLRALPAGPVTLQLRPP